MNITKTRPALLAALALLSLAAAAAGCGDDDEDATAAAGNATDAAFIADMTEHHQGAIEMAELARTRAEHREVRTLAADIVSAQESEIAAMERMRDDMHETDAHGGHMGMSESEMGMDMDMKALRRADPFDRAFIDAMVPHHQGAIAMAEKLLAEGEHPDLEKMAGDIIDAQTREIAHMREWRETWYGGEMADEMGAHE